MISEPPGLVLRQAGLRKDHKPCPAAGSLEASDKLRFAPLSYLPLGEKVRQEAVHGLLEVKVSCEGKRTKCQREAGPPQQRGCPLSGRKAFGLLHPARSAWDRGGIGPMVAREGHQFLLTPGSPQALLGPQAASFHMTPSFRLIQAPQSGRAWLWIRLFWDAQRGSSLGPSRLRFFHLALGLFL